MKPEKSDMSIKKSLNLDIRTYPFQVPMKPDTDMSMSIKKSLNYYETRHVHIPIKLMVIMVIDKGAQRDREIETGNEMRTGVNYMC